MAITARTSTSGTSVGTATVTKPAGCVDGDLIIAAFSTDFADAITPPSGWTQRVSYAFTGDQRLSVFSKIASSEPASWTFTSVAGHIIIWGAQAWLGVQNTLDVSNVLQTNSASIPPNLSNSGISPVSAGTMILYAATFDGGGSGAQSVTDPSGFTLAVNKYTSGTGFLYFAWQEKATAGATGTIAAVITGQTENDVGGTATLAFQLASAVVLTGSLGQFDPEMRILGWF